MKLKEKSIIVDTDRFCAQVAEDKGFSFDYVMNVLADYGLVCDNINVVSKLDATFNRENLFDLEPVDWFEQLILNTLTQNDVKVIYFERRPQ